MKDSHLISIIIPIYNVEQYLRSCLDSVIKQTYINLEIILVDDGSTDKSGLICDEYGKMDKRIRVIHQVNEGTSKARNVGLDICKGDYISFVDSDDYIDPQFVEKMYVALIKNKANISVCGSYKVDELGNFTTFYDSKNATLNFKEFITKCGTLANCGKLYANFLFDNIRFKEGVLYDDIYIYLPTFSRAKVVTVISDKLYYYRQRKNSIMWKYNHYLDNTYEDVLAHLDYVTKLYELDFDSQFISSTFILVLDLFYKKKKKTAESETKRIFLIIKNVYTKLYKKLTTKSKLFFRFPKLYFLLRTLKRKFA